MLVYYSDPALTELLLSFLHRRESGEAVQLILAEGDSWFSLGGLTSNLLMELDDENSLIVSCASPGDTFRHISDLGNEPFKLMLSKDFGVLWDRIYLSAGGNDIKDCAARVLYEGHIHQVSLEGVMIQVRAHLRRLLKTVRLYEQHCSVYLHTYDYPTPYARKQLFTLGPWIGPELKKARVHVSLYSSIAKELIDALALALKGEAEKDGNTFIIDTRGILIPARWRFCWEFGDWTNEIHPSFRGMRKIADKWREAL